MYTNIKDGKYLGTVYQALTQSIVEAHAKYGEQLIEVGEPPINIGTEEEPDYGYLSEEVLNNLFEQTKKAKCNEIDLHFENQYTPTLIGDTEWHGTFTSILKLKGVIDMAQIAGLAEATFFDYRDQPHSYSLAEATNIVMALGVEYQTKFAQKKALQTQVMACTTQAELDSISY